MRRKEKLAAVCLFLETSSCLLFILLVFKRLFSPFLFKSSSSSSSLTLTTDSILNSANSEHWWWYLLETLWSDWILYVCWHSPLLLSRSVIYKKREERDNSGQLHSIHNEWMNGRAFQSRFFLLSFDGSIIKRLIDEYYSLSFETNRIR